MPPVCFGSPKSPRRERRPLLKTSLTAHKSTRHLAIEEDAVTYCAADHISVMTQLYGSVWPQVLPFCLTNTILTAFLWIFDERSKAIDLSIDPSAHKYLSALVSFLVIARLRIIYNSSYHARGQLSVITQNAHEVVESATILTNNNTSEEAVLWRRSIALGVIKFLRDCMDALSYNSALIDVSKEEALEKRELFKRPTTSALALKKTIFSHRLDYGENLKDMIARPQTELFLLGRVEKCQDAFYKIDSLINTPFPFPLVQMARTILIFWVFTLPFALQHTPYPLWGICMLIFLLTYGFIGLESVCIELSDPFGDDVNDFDQVNLARITFEDIYLTIFRNDGDEEEVNKVREEADILLYESDFFRSTIQSMPTSPKRYEI